MSVILWSWFDKSEQASSLRTGVELLQSHEVGEGAYPAPSLLPAIPCLALALFIASVLWLFCFLIHLHIFLLFIQYRQIIHITHGTAIWWHNNVTSQKRKQSDKKKWNKIKKTKRIKWDSFSNSNTEVDSTTTFRNWNKHVTGRQYLEFYIVLLFNRAHFSHFICCVTWFVAILFFKRNWLCNVFKKNNNIYSY